MEGGGMAEGGGGVAYREQVAVSFDGVLVRLARGQGALDVAIGDALGDLSLGDRVLRLGYSNIGDYARERLGMPASTAQKMARLARELRERPVLRAAVQAGEVTARKADAVLPLARGAEEPPWTERARVETVRALSAAVRDAGFPVADSDEPWERLVIDLADEDRSAVNAALEVAGKLLGAPAPMWQRMEGIFEEYLGAHPEDVPD